MPASLGLSRPERPPRNAFEPPLDSGSRQRAKDLLAQGMEQDHSIETLAARLPKSGALIGLDLGTKTIGLSVSDLSRQIASADKTLVRKKFKQDSAEILALAEQVGAVGFVIGLPLNMNGSEGPRAQSTRAFVRNFAALTDLPIVFWDERLSTVAAERSLLEMDMSRTKRAKIIDATAAAFILQGALDRLAVIARTTPSAD